jgi:hypothetical protein
MRAGRGAAVTLFALLLLWLTIAVGAARSGATSAAVPFVSPIAPLFAGADAKVALANDQGRQAASAVAAGVAVSPLDPQLLMQLGAARERTGDLEGAQQARLAAASLGWRNTAVQDYWLDAALQAGDTEQAALRLDALLRMGRRYFQFADIVQALEASGEGRAAVSSCLAGRPGWGGDYAEDIGALDSSARARRLATIGLARAKGFVLDCGRVAPSVNAALKAGDVDQAAALWFPTCHKARLTGGVVDGDFSTGRTIPFAVPFEWNLAPSASIDVAFESAPAPLSGRALAVRLQSSVTESAALQYVRLAPGDYRITWRTVDEGGQPNPTLRPIVTCLGEGQSRNDAFPERYRDGFAADFTIGSVGCAAQKLSIMASPSGGLIRQSVWIDDVSIQRR